MQAYLNEDERSADMNVSVFMNNIYILKNQCADLLKQKTADYGDAWRDMRIESITDQILMKIERMRNIETQSPETAREACVEIVKDIVNYAVFGIVKFNGIA